MKFAAPRLLYLAVVIACLPSVAFAQETTEMPELRYEGRYEKSADSVHYQELLFDIMLAYQSGSDSTIFKAQNALTHLRESISGGDHPDLAQAISNYGYFLDAAGERQSARPLYIETLSMWRRMSPDDNNMLATAINNMAYFHYNDGNTTDAELLFLEAMDMKRRMYKEENQEIAVGINNLAVFYESIGNAVKAAAFYDEALAVSRRVYATDAPELGHLLSNIAHFNTVQGKYETAEQQYAEAREIFERIHGEKPHGDLLYLKNNIAGFYESAGRLDEAEQTYMEVLRWSRNLYTGDHPTTALILNNLGAFFQSRGMYAEAEPRYREALDMRRRLYSDPHPDLLRSLNNYGHFQVERGRYDGAHELFREAGQQLNVLFPGDHPNRALHLNNIAALYAKEERYVEAESLYTAALEMKQRLYSAPHRDIGLAYNNLGTVQKDRGRSEEARASFLHAAEIFRQLPATARSELAVVLSNLGRLELEHDNRSRGALLLNEALHIREDLYDDGHSELIVSHSGVAKMHAQGGRAPDALYHFEEVLRHISIALKESFSFDSENNQLLYMTHVLKPNLNVLAQFCVRHTHEPGAAELLLSAVFHSKGAVANESARRIAEWSKDRFSGEAQRELTRLREQDAQLASRQQDEGLRIERRSIQRRADSLDAALRKLDREYDKLRNRQDAGWRDVQRQMGPDEALIEFYAVPFDADEQGRTDTVMYTAVVLQRRGDPRIVRLVPETALLPYLTMSILPNRESYVTDPSISKALYALLWKPLEKYLKGMRRLYLVPDGVLHRVSFQALLIEDTPDLRYLDDVYELHQLTGARDLLSRNVRYRPQPYRRPRNGVLFGDPKFDAPGSASDETKNARKSWEALPGTREEVESIASLLRNEGIEHTLFVGKEAREEHVKELNGRSPRVLHLATHGYFFPVRRFVPPAHKEQIAMRGGAPQLRIEDNPMLRSGLVMTGVNSAWTGGSALPNGDDGILSALEISRLDLTGTELVTLSACETGLGDIENGEGIFGLQRAFQVAGVRQLLMSLWKVADKPTAEMMKLFYRAWLDSGDTYDAFRTARKAMRNEYPNPFFWAGFVLIER